MYICIWSDRSVIPISLFLQKSFVSVVLHVSGRMTAFQIVMSIVLCHICCHYLF